jgi:3-hydroxy-9,10-secoandrosta-1,3,5(10)-triene-9,17-dione monooxygenase reductase component
VIDAADYRKTLGQFPTGVTIITAAPSTGPVGMAVGSFTSVSLDPPLVGFLPTVTASAWPGIAEAQHFCVNILAADQVDLCRTFASKVEDRFAGLDIRTSVTGAPILPGVVAWIDCELHSVSDAGDHYWVMGTVKDMAIESDAEPMVFSRGRYGQFGTLPE